MEVLRDVRARGRRHLATFLAIASLALACARTTTETVTARPAPRDAGPGVATPNEFWNLRTLEHVDLWLHGFALLFADTAGLPLFRPGYRESVLEARRRTGTVTQLETNERSLSARFAANPGLWAAQFVALYFDSWDDLQRGAETFLRLGGDARRARNDVEAFSVATFATYFPSEADRDWLSQYLAALEDESRKFYHRHWLTEQRAHEQARMQVEVLFRSRLRPALQRFLANTQQGDGNFVLALPLAGEGRTLATDQRPRVVAVGLPAAPDSALEAIYAFAHEIVSPVTSVVIQDQTSDADRRAGLADRYSSFALVRGGAMLLERVLPELAPGYARYYLALARVRYTGDHPLRALEQAFPLPDALRDALGRQIDVVLGGI
jgi:hypothetical protein